MLFRQSNIFGLVPWKREKGFPGREDKAVKSMSNSLWVVNQTVSLPYTNPHPSTELSGCSICSVIGMFRKYSCCRRRVWEARWVCTGESGLIPRPEEPWTLTKHFALDPAGRDETTRGCYVGPCSANFSTKVPLRAEELACLSLGTWGHSPGQPATRAFL